MKAPGKGLILALCIVSLIRCASTPVPAPVLEPYGLFVHYGLYSVAGGNWNDQKVPFYAEQIMNHARISPEEYGQLALQFTATGFNADSIVQLAKDAGMKYILFTAKHHDGFCMYNSPSSAGYNSVEGTPSGRDFVAELAHACADGGMKLGLYFSLPDWHFPESIPIPRPQPDTLSDCTQFVNQVYSPLETISKPLEELIVKQITELLTQYGPIYTLWFDMGMPTAAQSQRFRQTVKKLQNDCLIGGRIGNYCGDYLTLPDNANVYGNTGFAWDSPASMFGTWGYRSWQEMPPEDVQVNRQLHRLVQTVSHGGSFVLNIGPMGDGTIEPYQASVLHTMGDWVHRYNNSIYEVQPSPFIKLPQGLACAVRPNPDLNGGIISVTVFEDYPVEHLFITPTHLGSVLHQNGLQNRISSAPSYSAHLFGKNTSSLPFVMELEYQDTLDVIQPGVEPNKDGTIWLNEDNGYSMAAYDAQGYLSCQSDAKKVWYIYNAPAGVYHVYATYLPLLPAQRYRLTVTPLGEKDTKKTHPLESVFPGVDTMLQNFYAGTFVLTQNSMVSLECVSNNPLEPLHLEQVSFKIIPDPS